MEKVSIRKCGEYDDAAEAVNLCFQDIGDVGISSDSKVLIKTNLLKVNRPKEMVTTHPEILRGVIEYLHNMGVYNITIGDSPGGPFNSAVLKAVYTAAGISQLARETGVKLNYNTASHKVFNEDGVILKQFDLCDYVTEADVVIDCAKLKTHQMTGYTGAVKNLFGCIPGTTKVEYHYRMPELKDFSNMLLDLALYIKPCISVIDAVYGLEGQGPSAGEPRKVGAVIASKSPTHADMVGIALMGVEPLDICTIARAKERGLILGRLEEDAEIVGDDIDELIVHDFKQAVRGSIKLFNGRVPKIIEKPLERLFSAKPVVKKNICIGCGVCRDSCPPQAIVMEKGKPVIDRDKCIKCYCCHELCPKKAITVKRIL